MFDVHLCVAFLARLGSRVGDHVRSNLLCAQKMNATAQQNQKGDLMDLVISGLGWSDFSPSSSGLMFRCFSRLQSFSDCFGEQGQHPRRPPRHAHRLSTPRHPEAGTVTTPAAFRGHQQEGGAFGEGPAQAEAPHEETRLDTGAQACLEEGAARWVVDQSIKRRIVDT